LSEDSVVGRFAVAALSERRNSLRIQAGGQRPGGQRPPLQESSWTTTEDSDVRLQLSLLRCVPVMAIPASRRGTASEKFRRPGTGNTPIQRPPGSPCPRFFSRRTGS